MMKPERRSAASFVNSRTIPSPGFTLVELLVSIGIIALLIGLLAPALGGARDRSRELGSTVNLRNIGQIFEMYTQEADGLYPAPVPGRFYKNPNPNMGTSTLSHWQTTVYWANLFLDAYPWAEHERMYLSPGAERDFSPGPVAISSSSSYVYSASFLGQPRIWTDAPIEDDEWETLERSVKRSMVRYPSAKALMWDRELGYIRRKLEKDDQYNLIEECPMLFADGHVETRVPSEGSEIVVNRAKYAMNARQKLHNTRDGVYGRDY